MDRVAEAGDVPVLDFYTDLSLVEKPWPYLERLRDAGPVAWLPDRKVVAVTGYDEALKVYNDTKTFSSINAVTGPLPPLPFEPEGDDIFDQVEANRDLMPFAREIVALDAPDHTRLRSLLMPLFTPRRLKSHEERFKAIANSLIDEFAGTGRVEFIGSYANPLATLIITELLGIPEEDRPTFRKYFEGGPAGQIGGSEEDRLSNPLIEMGYRIAQYIGERRAASGEDILSEFAAAKFIDGTTPTIEEATRAACFLFGAGQDTTTKLLGASFRIMAENPDYQRFLRESPDRIPDYIEEVLRFEGSIKTTHRLCRRSTELAGVAIPAGTTVMIANLAVNRDPERFPKPHAFDIERARRKEHIAFGRGAHTCAGAPLARAEVRISIECLLGSLENIRLAEDKHGAAESRRFRYEPSYVLRGLEELHLEFDQRG